MGDQLNLFFSIIFAVWIDRVFHRTSWGTSINADSSTIIRRIIVGIL